MAVVGLTLLLLWIKNIQFKQGNKGVWYLRVCFEGSTIRLFTIIEMILFVVIHAIWFEEVVNCNGPKLVTASFLAEKWDMLKFSQESTETSNGIVLQLFLGDEAWGLFWYSEILGFSEQSLPKYSYLYEKERDFGLYVTDNWNTWTWAGGRDSSSISNNFFSFLF